MGRNRPVQLRDSGAVSGRYASRAQRQVAEEEGASLAAVLVQGKHRHPFPFPWVTNSQFFYVEPQFKSPQSLGEVCIEYVDLL